MLGPAHRLNRPYGTTNKTIGIPAINRRASAPESAQQQRGESPLRRAHWLSVAEGNCVVERRGGEQPEANNQSIINTMMNLIRPCASASLLAKGEAGDRTLSSKRGGNSDDLCCGETVSAATTGMHGVVGDGMVGSWSDVNQGSRSGERKEFMTEGGPKSHPEGDRASIVAWKRGNARGAKGGRKLTIRKCEPEPNKTGVVPFGAVRVRANASLERTTESDPRLCNGACILRVALDQGISLRVLDTE